MLLLEIHGGIPFQGVEDLLLFPILRFIDNLGLFRDVKITSGNRMYLEARAGELVEGEYELTYKRIYDFVVLQSDGVSAWWIIG